MHLPKWLIKNKMAEAQKRSQEKPAELQRLCPQCGDTISYSTKQGYERACSNNSHCKRCALAKNRSDS